MRALFVAVLFSALTLSASAAPVVPRQIIGAEQDHSMAEADDCAHFYKTTFTTFPAQAHWEERREFFGKPGQALRVTASHEGGVAVRGWNRKYARLVVCRYASGLTEQAAQRTLKEIVVSQRSGEITVAGPPADPSRTWWVNMILFVPRNAWVDVRSSNGGIAIRNMQGQVTASSTTGGISLAQSSGDYRISTTSGGITLERVTGKVEAVSKDGTIALKLDPAATPSLEARSDDGEILCSLIECGGWSPGRKMLRLGHGAPGIRMTTSAPILITPVNN